MAVAGTAMPSGPSQDHADAHLLRMLAAAHLRFGRLSKADALLELAQRVSPEEAETATLRVIVALRRGDPEQAAVLLSGVGDPDADGPTLAVLRRRVQAMQRTGAEHV